MSLTVERTLAHLAVRQLLSRKQVLWMLLLATLPVLLAIVARADAPAANQAVSRLFFIYEMLVIPVLLPLVALVIGTGVFGQEIEDGTVTFVLGKPVPRWRIVIVRILVAAAATAVILGVATLATGLVALRRFDAGAILGFLAANSIGALLYCALFVALSLTVRRALIPGLLYVVAWEGTLAMAFAGTRNLSIRQYVLSLADAFTRSSESMDTNMLDVNTAIPMALVVLALATVYSIRKLQGFEIGETA